MDRYARPGIDVHTALACVISGCSLIKLFTSGILKLSSEGANVIYLVKMFHALIVPGRKKCRYASDSVLSHSGRYARV